MIRKHTFSQAKEYRGELSLYFMRQEIFAHDGGKESGSHIIVGMALPLGIHVKFIGTYKVHK